MKTNVTIQKSANSKGAAIFKKMLEDKERVRKHLKSGGKISDLKDELNLVKTVSLTGA